MSRASFTRILAAAVLAAALLPAAARAAAPGGPALAAAVSDPWQEARRMADAAQYDSALAVLRAALERDPGSFDLRWLQAGITGEAGRHREAVVLYERLSTDEPARAGELLGDLATERLWADDNTGAVHDFRRWLAANPGDRLAQHRLALALAQSDSLGAAMAAYDSLVRRDPGDTDLALERARVLGWSDRHAEAIAAYRAVLARDSTNTAARLGLALNENWSGRHRAATRDLEAIAAGTDADPEAGKALAFARWWDGDPDGARDAVDAYLRAVPEDREALDLSRAIARENRPTLSVAYGRADDSDGLRVEGPAMEFRTGLGRGTSAWAGWRRDHLRDAGGTRSPLRVTAGVQQRWSAAWTTSAEATHIDWGERVGLPVSGALTLVHRPMDRVRLEAGVSREPILTRASIEQGISLLSWIGAVDVTPLERLGLHADAREGRYSDGNRAERVAVRARFAAWSTRRSEVALLAGSEQLNTRLDLDNGYYDPDFHREWGPGLEAEWRRDGRWTLGAATTWGWQHDKGSSGSPPFYNASARAELHAGDAWTLALEGGRSDSSLQNAGGYERRWWTASLLRGF